MKESLSYSKAIIKSKIFSKANSFLIFHSKCRLQNGWKKNQFLQNIFSIPSRDGQHLSLNSKHKKEHTLPLPLQQFTSEVIDELYINRIWRQTANSTTHITIQNKIEGGVSSSNNIGSNSIGSNSDSRQQQQQQQQQQCLPACTTYY